MNFFRSISFLEGISYLLILSVTLGFISRDHVAVLGMTHGVLFMLYITLSLFVAYKQGWSVIKWLLIFAASLIPFAFIAVEMSLRQETPNTMKKAP